MTGIDEQVRSSTVAGQAHRPEASGRIGLHNQLADLGVQFLHPGWLIALALPRRNLRVVNIIIAPVRTAAWGIDHRRQKRSSQPRSEEHTSELQSLMRISYAVFRLKKKTP